MFGGRVKGPNFWCKNIHIQWHQRTRVWWANSGAPNRNIPTVRARGMWGAHAYKPDGVPTSFNVSRMTVFTTTEPRACGSKNIAYEACPVKQGEYTFLSELLQNISSALSHGMTPYKINFRIVVFWVVTSCGIIATFRSIVLSLSSRSKCVEWSIFLVMWAGCNGHLRSARRKRKRIQKPTRLLGPRTL